MKLTTTRKRTIFSTIVASVLAFCVVTPSMAQSTGRTANNNNRPGLGARLGNAIKNEQAQNRQNQARTQQPAANPQVRTGAPQPPATAAQATKPTAQSPQIQTVNLKSSQKVGSATMVEVTLEANGDVLQTNVEGKTERAKMEIVAGFKYEEIFDQYSANGTLRSFRCYEKAGMKRKLGANVTIPLLDRSRKFIVSEFDGKHVRLYSSAGPMKYDQYALLSELAFNTTLLDRLLPGRDVKLGDDWIVDNATIAALLGVDAIENNTVRLTVTSVVDNFAEIELYQVGQKDANGVEAPSTLVCASEGASVALDLEGKFQFDLKSKRITWFGIHINERRSESVATPGLDLSATLKINLAPLDAPEKLDEETIAPLKKEVQTDQLKLYYNAQTAPWKFQHSRKWKMISDQEKVTELCYLENGEAIAQCNILSNGRIELSTKPTLDGYKEEIQKSLGSRFAEFKQEAAYDGPNDSSVYYVVADGAYDDIPFRWVYYLITDKDGNQATIMFEIRADMLEQYDDSGNDIVESFRLSPRQGAGLKESLEQQNSQTKEDTTK